MIGEALSKHLRGHHSLPRSEGLFDGTFRLPDWVTLWAGREIDLGGGARLILPASLRWKATVTSEIVRVIFTADRPIVSVRRLRVFSVSTSVTGLTITCREVVVHLARFPDFRLTIDWGENDDGLL